MVLAFLGVLVANDLGVLTLLRVGLLEPLSTLAEGEHGMPGGGVLIDGDGEVELSPPDAFGGGAEADALA